MKREELYRNRGTRPRSTSCSRVRCNNTQPKTNNNVAKYLPLCHWLQLCLCIFILLLLISSRSFIQNEKLQEFHSSLNQQITHTTDLQNTEWSGSLKEILLIKE